MEFPLPIGLPAIFLTSSAHPLYCSEYGTEKEDAAQCPRRVNTYVKESALTSGNEELMYLVGYGVQYAYSERHDPARQKTLHVNAQGRYGEYSKEHKRGKMCCFSNEKGNFCSYGIGDDAFVGGSEHFFHHLVNHTVAGFGGSFSRFCGEGEYHRHPQNDGDP